MVAPGGAIIWLSCGIGPVPAMPSGADSGGGAGREPAAILAVSACAAAVPAAADGAAPDEAAPGQADPGKADPREADPGGAGDEEDEAAAGAAGELAAAELAAATGFFSHQRCSTGMGCRVGVTACWSRVISRLLLGPQSGSQHSCSRRTSSSTCGSPIAASCFQASVLNGGKKSFLANSRFLQL